MLSMPRPAGGVDHEVADRIRRLDGTGDEASDVARADIDVLRPLGIGDLLALIRSARTPPQSGDDHTYICSCAFSIYESLLQTDFQIPVIEL